MATFHDRLKDLIGEARVIHMTPSDEILVALAEETEGIYEIIHREESGLVDDDGEDSEFGDEDE